jgi:hypothetical protein
VDNPRSEAPATDGLGADYLALKTACGGGPLVPRHRPMRRLRHDPLYVEAMLRLARTSLERPPVNYIPARGYSKYDR